MTKVAESIISEAAKPHYWKSQPLAPNYSLRVEIALWEKDLEAAWVAAGTGSCHRSLLLTLAGKLEPSRPNDAISLYRRVVPIIVEETNNAAYAEAINLIRKLGRLMKAQHQLRQFDDYRAELRARFKPKRNFIKLLDGLR
ncbi:MAG: hypothetical protein SH820_07815 [Xanthomonadales bacterium]|nr:hypothetical protein [Xanthomonadales bacterium]